VRRTFVFLAAVAVLLVLARRPLAESRTARMTVSVTVVRSCSIYVPSGASGLSLTCARGATPGVLSGESARVHAVRPGSTTIVPIPPPRADAPGPRVVLLNF
jgi:hypothetical protein